MILTTITQTGTGRSNICAVDDFQTPFSVGIGAKLVSGSATFNIEYSFDDPMAAGYTPAGATWYVASGFSALSATTGGSFTIPCKAISINITANTGTVTAQIVQAGPV
jgi:hypothetical protein